MGALTVYMTGTAATTVSTADTLTTSIPASETSHTTKTGKLLAWGVLWSQGTANAWAAGVSEPTFGDVHGFLLDDTSLEGRHIAAGTWTFSIKVSTSSGTVTATGHIRAGKRTSGGVYTQIVDAATASTGITSVAGAITATASGADTAFAVGDKLYIEVDLNITANTSSSTTATTSLFQNGGTNERCDTPGTYIPSALTGGLSFSGAAKEGVGYHLASGGSFSGGTSPVSTLHVSQLASVSFAGNVIASLFAAVLSFAGKLGIRTTRAAATATLTSSGSATRSLAKKYLPSLYLNSSRNQMSTDQSSFEKNVSGWTIFQCSIADSTDQALYGSSSMKVTASAPQPSLVSMIIGVTPGLSYTAVASYFTAASLVSAEVDLAFYSDASVINVGFFLGSNSVLSTNQWTEKTVTATAPATAAYAKVTLSLSASNTNVIYVDGVGFWQGSSTTWSPGDSNTIILTPPPYAAAASFVGSITRLLPTRPIFTATLASVGAFAKRMAPASPTFRNGFLRPSGSRNRLANDSATFENSAWTLGLSRCTTASDTTHALVGTHAMLVTATAGGPILAQSPVRGCTVGVTYTASVWVYVTSNFKCLAQLQYQNPGVLSNGQPGSVITLVPNAWTQVSVTAVCPAGMSATAILLQFTDGIDTIVNGSQMWVDEAGIWEGSSTTWTPGDTNPLSITRSIPAALTSAGSIANLVINKLVSAIGSFAGAITSVYSPFGGGGINTPKALSAGLSFAGAQAVSTAKATTAALSFTGTQVRSIAKFITAGASFVGSTLHATAHTLSAATLGLNRVRTNLVTNPSFEVDIASGWFTYTTSGTVVKARDTAEQQDRTASLHVSAASPGDGGLKYQTPVLAATAWAFSAWVKTGADVTNACVVIRSNGNNAVMAGSHVTLANQGWQRISGTFTADGVNDYDILLALGSYGSTSSGDAWFDAVLLESGAQVLPYFDGASVSAGSINAWTGTADASSSTNAPVSMTRAIGKAAASAGSFVGAMSGNAIGHRMIAGASFVGSQVRSAAKVVTAGASFSGSALKATAQSAMTGSLSFTGAKALSVATRLTAAASFSGAALRSMATARTSALSFVGARTSAISRAAMTATLTSAGARSIAVGHKMTAVLTSTGSRAISMARSLAASGNFVGSLSRSVARLLGASALSFSGAVTQGQAFFRTLTGAASFVGSIPVRAIGKALVGAGSFSGSRSQSIVKIMAAGGSFSGSLYRSIAHSFAATGSFAGTLVRTTSTRASAALAFAGTRSVAIGTRLTAVIASAGARSMSMTRTLSASETFAGSLPRTIAHLLTAAALSSSGVLTRGQAFFRTLTASASSSGSLPSRAIAKLLAAVASSSGTQSRSITKTMSAISAPTSAQSRSIARSAITATVGFVGSLPKSILRTATAASMSFAGSLPSRQIGKALAATGSFAGSSLRAIAKKLSASSSTSGSMLRATSTRLSGSASFAGSLPGRAISKLISASGSFTGSQSRSLAKKVSGSLTSAGATTRAIARNPIAAALAFSGAVSSGSASLARTLTAAASFAGSSTRAVAKTLTGGASFSGAATRVIGFARTLAATLTSSAVFNTAIAKRLSGSASFAGAQMRATSKAISASVSLAGNRTVALAKALAAAGSFVGSATRGVGHRLVGAALTASGVLLGSTQKRLTAAATFSVAQAHAIIRNMTANATFTGIRNSAIPRTITASLSSAGNATKAVTRRISAALSSVGAMTSGGFTRLLTATLSSTGQGARDIAKRISSAASFSGSATRVVPRLFLASLTTSASSQGVARKTFTAVSSFLGNLARFTAASPQLVAHGIAIAIGAAGTPYVGVMLPGSCAGIMLVQSKCVATANVTSGIQTSSSVL